jgi:hypothetical protein
MEAPPPAAPLGAPEGICPPPAPVGVADAGHCVGFADDEPAAVSALLDEQAVRTSPSTAADARIALARVVVALLVMALSGRSKATSGNAIPTYRPPYH